MDYKKEFYGEDGKQVETELEACAKMITNLENHTIRYFVKYMNGLLYNPLNSENKRRSIHKAVFIKTTETAFLLYLRFLRTKGSTSLLQAQREHKR